MVPMEKVGDMVRTDRTIDKQTDRRTNGTNRNVLKSNENVSNHLLQIEQDIVKKCSNYLMTIALSCRFELLVRVLSGVDINKTFHSIDASVQYDCSCSTCISKAYSKASSGKVTFSHLNDYF